MQSRKLLSILALMLSLYATSSAQTKALNDSSMAVCNRASELLKAGQIDDAYALYTSALQISQYAFPAYQAKIGIDYKRGELAAAKATAEAYVANTSAHADALVYLGVMQALINDPASDATLQLALKKYDKDYKKAGRDYKQVIGFKQGIVASMLGTPTPVYKSKNASASLPDSYSPEAYAASAMSYQGLNFF
jgi:tetratricopeptide (TPR) repeat protein